MTDSGIGIPGHRLADLFSKFSQVPETRGKVREVRGTGLGLAICKQLVASHGGTISAESEYERGSAFLVCLPVPKALLASSST